MQRPLRPRTTRVWLLTELLAGLVCAAALGSLLSCDGSTPPSDPTTPRQILILDPPGQDVGLRPGEERALRVRYADLRQNPISGTPIQFAVFGDPRGSTLSEDIALSGPDGVAQVQIRAGAETCRFQVSVTAQGAAESVFYVEVSEAGFGALQVSAYYAGDTVAEEDLAAVRYHLLGQTDCAALDPLHPPAAQRERTVQGALGTVLFKALPLNQDHAVLVLAEDAGARPRAWGCIEVPRGVLEVDRTLALMMKIQDYLPALTGQFLLTSRFVLPGSPEPGSRPLADALRRWGDLSDCPNDPAQLILDCVLDALDAGDPLDCAITSPSAQTEVILAERGALSQGCRGDKTVRGTASLDGELRAIMESSSAPMLSSLHLIEPLAQIALGSFELESELQVTGQSRDHRTASASHRLRTISFQGPNGVVAIPLAGIGLPVPLASAVGVTLNGWHATLAQHQLTLRFGLIARAALSEISLASSGLPRDSEDLAAALIGTLKTSGPSGALQGCAALGALVCDASRLETGCLGDACAAGLNALAGHLDQGFQLNAGQRTDLALSGEAELIDEDGDLQAERLGGTDVPGSWDARMTVGAESVTPAKATFVGKRY